MSSQSLVNNSAGCELVFVITYLGFKLPRWPGTTSCHLSATPRWRPHTPWSHFDAELQAQKL